MLLWLANLDFAGGSSGVVIHLLGTVELKETFEGTIELEEIFDGEIGLNEALEGTVQFEDNS